MGRKWICGRIHGSCGMRILNQKLVANDTSNPMLVSKLTLPNNKGWDKWWLESIFSQQSVDIFAVSISPQPQFCLLGHQLYHFVDQSLQIGQDMDVIATYATNEPLSSWIYESSSTNLAFLQSVKSFYYALVSICVNNIVDVGRVACIAKPKSTQVYQILVVLGVQGCRANIYPYTYVISYGNRRTWIT